MPANESFVGRAAQTFGVDVNAAGFKAMRAELQIASNTLNQGLLAGVIELATGGSKVKAVWESIKWSALARSGLLGFSILLGGANALAFGIRKIVAESGALQAAINRLTLSKSLTRQFEALLGSASAAKQRVAELYSFAASSRFDFSSIAAASRALTVLTNGARGSFTDLERLGKISTATSTPLEDLAGAVGQASNSIQHGLDFSGPLSQLRAMGAISEGTTERLQAMGVQGASTAAIMDAFEASLKNSSDTLGETERSIDDLAASTEKAKEQMAADFAAPFVADHRKQIELTGKIYQNFTGVVGELGQMMATITEPFAKVQTAVKEVAASKSFAGIIGEVAKLGVALVPVTAAFLTLKGLKSMAITGVNEYQRGGAKGIADLVIGNISPKARSRDWLARAGRMEESGAPNIAVKGAELMSQGWTKVGTALEFVVSKMPSVISWLSRAAAPVAVLSVVAFVAEKAWSEWNDQMERARRISDMSDSINKDNAAMQKQAAAMQTRDDYLQLLTDAQNRYNAALEEEAAIQANSKMNEEDRHAAAAKTAAAGTDLNKVKRMDTSQLGAGRVEIDVAMRRFELERQIRDIIFEARVARASDGEKAVMLAERRVEAEKRAAEYSKSEQAKPEIEAAKKAYESAGTTDDALVKKTEAEVKRITEERDNALEARTKGAPEQGGENQEDLNQKVDDLNAELDDARDRLAQVTVSGPRKASARGDYMAALAKGGTGDRLEAQALAEEAKPSPNHELVSALRQQAAEARKVEGPEARERAETIRAQSLSHMRQMAQTTIGQAYQGQALGITSESYQAEDVRARQRIAENNEALAEATKNYRPDQANEEAKLAHKQQVEAIRLENAQIQKEIDERARGLAREQAAWKSAVDAHAKNNEAVLAAAKGNFGQADAAAKAAQTIEDNQAKVDRAFELKQQGYAPGDVTRIVGAEQKQREADRATRADAFRATEGRRIEELELENKSRGIGSTDATGDRRKLIGMQDIDAFREQLAKNLQELGPGHAKEASDLALKATSAGILGQSQVLPGSGQVADSLAQLGLGGGVYAGVGGDPQLEAQKRIGDLTAEANKILQSMDKKLDLGVK